MGIKRVVVLIAVMSLLVICTVPPTPARADGTETALLVCGSIAAYVGLVFLGTWLVNRSPQPWAEFPEDFQVDRKHPPAALRFGPKCRQNSTELTLVCW
jgi:hypothetical protein